MFEFIQETGGNHDPVDRIIYVKVCPVCKSIFHIPGVREVLQVWCKDCDTDYFFSKKEDLPISCKNHPVKSRGKCSCLNCQK
jgi:hypothetical protein